VTARRPSPITRLGVTGAPGQAAEVTPPAPADTGQSQPASPPADTPVPVAPAGVWRRVIEVQARKTAAATARARQRVADLAAVIEQARAAGADVAELREGLTAAGMPPEDWPDL
jgi:hypothetical protein